MPVDKMSTVSYNQASPVINNHVNMYTSYHNTRNTTTLFWKQKTHRHTHNSYQSFKTLKWLQHCNTKLEVGGGREGGGGQLEGKANAITLENSVPKSFRTSTFYLYFLWPHKIHFARIFLNEIGNYSVVYTHKNISHPVPFLQYQAGL